MPRTKRSGAPGRVSSRPGASSSSPSSSKGGLAGLVKRKPLEAIGAAAAVIGVGYLWYRHQQNANAQTTPGGTGQSFTRIPQFGGGGGSGGGRGSAGGNTYQRQTNAIEAQLDQLQRSRDRRRRPPAD